MTKYDAELYKIKAQLCKALSDSKRLMMISELRSGEKTVSEIAEAIEISQPATSHHLAVLRDGGIAIARRDGPNVYYCLADPEISEACDIVHNVLMNRMAKHKELADRFVS